MTSQEPCEAAEIRIEVKLEGIKLNQVEKKPSLDKLQANSGPPQTQDSPIMVDVEETTRQQRPEGYTETKGSKRQFNYQAEELKSGATDADHRNLEEEDDLFRSAQLPLRPDAPIKRSSYRKIRAYSVADEKPKERTTFTKSPPPFKQFQCKDLSEATILSRVFFYYVQPLLDMSLHSKINLKAMGELPEHLKVETEMHKLEICLHDVMREHPESRFKILRAILKSHHVRYSLFILAKFLLALVEMTKPMIVTEFILFIANVQVDGVARDYSWAYKVGLTYLVVELVAALLWENLLFMITQAVHIQQNALKAVLLKKHFTIARASSQKTYDSGELHNMIERDVKAVFMLLGQLPEVLQIPFELTVAFIFVYDYLGCFALIGLFFYGLALALTIYSQKRHKFLYGAIQRAEDSRIQQISEAISNVKTYKLYGWVNSFYRSIRSDYGNEISQKRQVQQFDSMVSLLQDLLNKLVPVLVFFIYSYFGNQCNLPKVMLTSVMFSKAKSCFSQITQLFTHKNEMLALMDKIHDFICCSDFQEGLLSYSAVDTPSGNALELKGNFSWGIKEAEYQDKETCDWNEKTTIGSHLVLKGIDLKIRRGEFVCVVGGVGSGKSSLIHQFIGQLAFIPQKEIDFVGGIDAPISRREMHALNNALSQASIPEGEAPVRVNGDLAFVGDDFWIQNTTIRGNILFGLEFDPKRYVKTCLACSLEQDFLQLADGDLTKIGDHGIQLSGGQKARVSLARALYSQPDIVILDSIFNAVDKRTSSTIFDQVLLKALAGKTRLLITDDFDHIKHSDRVIVMKDGSIHADGTFEELKRTNVTFADILSQNCRAKLETDNNQTFQKNAHRPQLTKSNRASRNVTNPLELSKRLSKIIDEEPVATDILRLTRQVSFDPSELLGQTSDTERYSFMWQNFAKQETPQKNASFRSKRVDPREVPAENLNISRLLSERRDSRGAEIGEKSTEIDARFGSVGRRMSSRAFYSKGELEKVSSESRFKDKINLFENRKKVMMDLKRNTSWQNEQKQSEERIHLNHESPLGRSTNINKATNPTELTVDEIQEKIKLWAAQSEADARKSHSQATRKTLVTFKELQQQQKSQTKVTFATFRLLANKMGGFVTVAGLVIAQFALHYMEIYSARLRSQWANIDEQSEFRAFTVASLHLLCVFVVSLGLGYLIETSLIKRISHLSQNVHDEVLALILKASINHYYDVTPVGIILQAYQRDIETFNSGLLQSLQVVMKLVSWFITISAFVTAVSVKALLCMLGVGSLIVWYAHVFLSVNTNMRDLEFEQRESIVASLADALKGRNVIQAYKVSAEFINVRMRLLDNTTVKFIAHQSAIAWFNIRVFFSSKLITLLGIVVCIEMKGTLSDTALFMIVTYSMNLQWINSLVVTFGKLQHQVQQVEILQKIYAIPQERLVEGECDTLSQEWPQKGKVEFRNVVARYHAEQEPVLKGVSISVGPGNTMGVVGRTGSGKSTLVNALVRLIELEGGEILIDGVNIASVPLETLRSKITVISQESEMFQGTLRQNLDPFLEYDDETIELAIFKSGIAKLLVAEEGHCACFKGEDILEDQAERELDQWTVDGNCLLDFEIEERGQNVSIGMRQLICSIRALLRKSKIVVMDESTSAVDPMTEQTIQQFLNDEFSEGVTVLSVAHRVNTILQNDEVVVLQDGVVVEQGPIERLQSDPKSYFNQLLLLKEQSQQTMQESIGELSSDAEELTDLSLSQQRR